MRPNWPNCSYFNLSNAYSEQCSESMERWIWICQSCLGVEGAIPMQVCQCRRLWQAGIRGVGVPRVFFTEWVRGEYHIIRMVHHCSGPGITRQEIKFNRNAKCSLLQNKPSDKQQRSLRAFNQKWIPQLRNSFTTYNDVAIPSSLTTL